MSRRRSVLVQTVGTSLVSNVGDPRMVENFEGWVASQPPSDRELLMAERARLVAASLALRQDRLEDVAELLEGIRGRVRVLGAEVASLEALRAEGAYAALRSVLLLHSDTPEGLTAATVLQSLLGKRFGLLVERRRVVQLVDTRASTFKVVGLRNLVSELARVTQLQGAEQVVIDATGGFKAQIATAVAFGQAFGIPVLYLFERFPEIIEFPPLPFRVDLSLVEAHHDLLASGEVPEASLLARFGAPLSEANTAFAQFSICLAGPSERAGGVVWEVSPMGQLLLEVWRAHRASLA